MKTSLRCYKNEWSGQINIQLSCGPILKYCPNCHNTEDEYHPYFGSRYGFVQSFQCSNCNGEVTIVDHDCRPPIQYFFNDKENKEDIPLGSRIYTIIDYEMLYGLNSARFRDVEEFIETELIPWKEDEAHLDLEDIIEISETKILQRVENILRYKITHPFLQTTPEIFQKWMDIVYTSIIMNKKTP